MRSAMVSSVFIDATSSTCSFRNQSMNCSPRASPSARAAAKSASIWAVTCFSCFRASSIGALWSAKSLMGWETPGMDGQVAVELVLHEHHGVVSLLDGLLVEVAGQLRKVLVVVPNRDRNVLLGGRKFVADLLAKKFLESCHGPTLPAAHPAW